jgi:hypothetical protein
MTSTSTTPLGRFTVTIEMSTEATLTAEETQAEYDSLTEILRRVYLVALDARGWTLPREKKVAMVAKMKATRLARGIDWPRGDNHWTRR